MNRFIVIITAATTLSHAVVGCCAHVSHGAGRHDEVHSVCSDHHQHESSHVGLQHEPIDQRAPDRGEECCQAKCKCKWLSPNTVDDLAFELLWYSTIFDEDQLSNSESSHSLLSMDSPADALSALPVRSHLALGVLLI